MNFYLQTLLRAFYAENVNVEHLAKNEHHPGYFVCGFSLPEPSLFETLTKKLQIKCFARKNNEFLIVVSEEDLREFIAKQFVLVFEKIKNELAASGNLSLNYWRGTYEGTSYCIDEYTYKYLSRGVYCEYFQQRGLGFGSRRSLTTHSVYLTRSILDDFSHEASYIEETIYYICPEAAFVFQIYPELAPSQHNKFQKQTFLSGSHPTIGKESSILSFFQNPIFDRQCLNLIFALSKQKDTPTLCYFNDKRDAPDNKEENTTQTKIDQLIESLNTEIKKDGTFTDKELKQLKIAFLQIINIFRKANTTFSFKSCIELAIALERDLYIKSSKGDISARTQKIIQGILHAPESKEEYKGEIKLVT